MGQTEKLSIEGHDAGQRRKGYFISKGLLLILIILVVLVIAITAVIAVHFAKESVEGDKSVQVVNPTGGATTSAGPISTGPTPTAEPTKAGPEPYWQIRLPRNVVPVGYDVSLDVDMKNFAFTGKTIVDINVTSSDSKFILVHSLNMKTVTALMTDSNGKDVPILKQFEFKKNQYYVLQFADVVPKGLYKLHFEHYSMLDKNLHGFYKGSYKHNGVEHFVAATQFQPTDCRKAFPSFDEPALKSEFTITLIHDPKYLAVTNMPLASSETKDGKKVDHFQKTIKMPTYLLAFVIGEFGSKKTMAGNVSTTYYAPPHQVEQLDVAVDAGTTILPYFEKFFGTPYPLPKSDMMAVPDFAAGAMENWGLILYRETALLYKDGESAASNRQRVSLVISHELAHQWFGNYVTMEWWSDLWLNEGFASYVEYFGLEALEPSWKMMDQFVLSDQNRALGLDALVTSHPVYVEVKSPDEINEIFDTISYAKGCSILRMLGDFLGLDNFKKGLKGYLSKYALGNAKTTDLWDSLGEVTTGVYDVGKIMNSWTLQMGFPVVTVTRTATGFKISQERFLADPDADLSKSKYNSSYNYLWYVPFKYESFSASGQSEGIKTVWMNLTKDVEVTASTGSKVLKGNAGQNGFYRVNYEQAEWKKISDALKANYTMFSVADRAGLLGDVFALASAGKIPYGTVLDVFDYIDRETEYVPWSMGNGKIGYLSSVLSKSSAAYKHFKTFMIKKVSKRYAEVDFNKKETDHLTILKQKVIVGAACRYGIASCLSNASKMFTDWMDSDKSIDPNYRSMVYYYGIRNGGVKEWDYAFNKAQQSAVASERSNLQYGLAATQESWLINRYLKYALNASYVKQQDAPSVFSYICNAGPLGSSNCWNFFKENWQTIRTRFGSGFFAMRTFINAVASSFSTQFELDEFNAFFKSQDDLGTAARAVTQARESIIARMKWLAKYEAPVSDWLAKNYQ